MALVSPIRPMIKRGYSLYKNGGIKLILVEGAATLMVKQTKGDGTLSVGVAQTELTKPTTLTRAPRRTKRGSRGRCGLSHIFNVWPRPHFHRGGNAAPKNALSWLERQEDITIRQLQADLDAAGDQKNPNPEDHVGVGKVVERA